MEVAIIYKAYFLDLFLREYPYKMRGIPNFSLCKRNIHRIHSSARTHVGKSIIWLVVWNISIFPCLGNVIIPFDSYFSEGLKPPTSHEPSHKSHHFQSSQSWMVYGIVFSTVYPILGLIIYTVSSYIQLPYF